ncbi:MAG: cytochrome c [Pseudorhodoplanes sp.]
MSAIAVVAATSVLAVASQVTAQSDPVEARRAEMKAMSRYIYRSLNRMQRGQEPYNQAQVDAALTQIVASTQKLPNLFPPGSVSGTKPGEDFRTSEKIWTEKPAFEARFAKLGQDAAADRGKIVNLDALKAAYPELRRQCDGCHENYLIKN